MMAMQMSRGRLVYSRPADASFESYKSWIIGTYQAMTGKPACDDDLDEEELRRDWHSFWGTEDDPDRPSQQQSSRSAAGADEGAE
jgi:hypothetical protein